VTNDVLARIRKEPVFTLSSYSPSSCLEGLIEADKNLNLDNDFAELRRRHFLMRSLERYRYTNLLGHCLLWTFAVKIIILNFKLILQSSQAATK